MFDASKGKSLARKVYDLIRADNVSSDLDEISPDTWSYLCELAIDTLTAGCDPGEAGGWDSGEVSDLLAYVYEECGDEDGRLDILLEGKLKAHLGAICESIYEEARPFDIPEWLDEHPGAWEVVEDTARCIASFKLFNTRAETAENGRTFGRCEVLSMMCGGKASPSEWLEYIEGFAKDNYDRDGNRIDE